MKDVAKLLLEWYQGVAVVVLMMNVIGFVSMGIDKWLAKKQKWRISERTLLGIAAAFGSLGSLIGMRYFHHKTKKAKFYLGVPCLLLLQLGLVSFVFLSK